MGRTATAVVGLAATIGAIFAFGPSPVERVKVDAPAVTAPDAAGVLVVDLIDGVDEADLVEIENVIGHDLHWTHPLSIDEGLAQGRVSDLDDAVAMLMDHPLVEAVEPVVQYEMYGYPNDPMYDKQWNMRQMGAPQGWATSPSGKGIVVAVVDTGVAVVEDLEGTKVLKGQTFVPGTKTAVDDQGHGTHVAGTIAQTTNNGKGVVGVAPNATILPVKVLSKWGMGSSSWIAAGIDYAVDEGADVINLSLGGGYSAVIHNAIKKAEKQGVIVVAAAGNSGRRGVGYPGALTEAIGVSATGPGGHMAPYSSYGKGVDISAPGGDKTISGGGVLQDTIDGKGGHAYAEYQGTSMATPHVAGAAAVLLSQGMPAGQVRETLLRTAKGDGKWDEKYGHGQLDLGAALGNVGPQHGGTKFALGMMFALLVSHLAGAGTAFRTIGAVSAGFFAGGAFFLTMLPVPEWTVVQLLSTGVLQWPAILLGPEWMHFPLWLSALVPGIAAFVLGAFRESRPVALGLACGVGAALFHGAATMGLSPWWMPAALGNMWLVLNGTLCVLFALALAGAEKIEMEAR